MSRARSLPLLDSPKKTPGSSPLDHMYDRLDELDGSHPLKEALPEGYIAYPVRELQRGKVSYFNFHLAKEMGLIDADHPHRLTKALEAKLVKTFSIRIINEYDQTHHIQYPAETVKKNSYMATRYLQLQHPNKTGKTSGDGRCIWNGTIAHKNIIWDVSSRGTGVTCLSPGMVQAGRPLRSGNRLYGYGCGLAENDELYGAAIMAEIFHNNGIATERMLCIIDLGRGNGIGVRAAPNLIRPAHFFMYLKQNQLPALQRSVNYFIERQCLNGVWHFSQTSVKKYDHFLDLICESFAAFMARLDRDYIFAWLDWDGDNILASAGIIDYGSVRQFGLRHDQYRYDDIDRFSSNLTEQRLKARKVVQVFAQMVDFLKTGTRKPLSHFRSHNSLDKYDIFFERSLKDRFLYQLGFLEPDRDLLLLRHRKAVDNLFVTYRYFESMKTHCGTRKVADGVNRPAIFNMRALNRTLAQFLMQPLPVISLREVYRVLIADSATRRDHKRGLDKKIQKRLLRLLSQAAHLTQKLVRDDRKFEDILLAMQTRAEMINRESRMTGNALINVVHEILEHRKKGLTDHEIQQVMESLIADQCLSPDMAAPGSDKQPQHQQPASWAERSQRLMRTLLTVVEGYKEDI